MDEKVGIRLKRFVELPDGSTAETLDGLRKYLSEHPAEPVYARRRGKLVLVGWQTWLPGTYTAP